MSSWSACRGQVEPLAALAAVAALGIALALYAGVLEDAAPTSQPAVEEATLVRSVAVLRTGAVVVPGRADSVGPPDGYRLRVTVRAANRTWTAGPEPPADAGRASRSVPVRVSPGVAVPGRVLVEVWPWPGA